MLGGGIGMKLEDILAISFAIICIILLLGGIIFLIVSTEKYYELKDTIESCNKNLGEEQWTFIETKDYYSCKSMKSITTTNSICSINGIIKDCEDLDMEINK